MADTPPLATYFTEIGATGAPDWQWGLSDRYLEKLRGPGGIDLMAKVLRKEPAAFTLNNAIMLSARQAKWTCIGATDKPGDRRAAAFVEECMNDMSQDWRSVIRFALTGTAFGFSDLMIVFKRRLGRNPPAGLPTSAYNDGRVGLRKLAIRRQETIKEWQRDENGDYKAMIQLDPVTGAEYPPVPIERLLHFRFGEDRGGWEGMGWLEPAFKLSYFIEQLEILYGIGAQRAHVGLPVFKYLAKPDKDTQGMVERIARYLTVNEQQYVTYPGEVVEFRLETVTNTNGAETRQEINQLRWEILMLGLATFLRLGSTESGARSLADPLITLFLASIDGALEEISAVANRHLVTRLLAANPTLIAGITDWPQISAASVQTAPAAVMNYLDQISRFLVTARPEDEQWLRNLVGMPEVTLEQLQAEEEAVEPQPDAAEDPNTPMDDSSQVEQLPSAPQAMRGALLPNEFWRMDSVAREYAQASQMLAAVVNGHGLNGKKQ